MDDDAPLWWPCPNCGESDRSKVHWHNPHSTLHLKESAPPDRRFFADFSCDSCKQSGRLRYVRE